MAVATGVVLVWGAGSLQAQVAPVQPALDAAVECAWWVETSTDNSNVLYPDTAAAYWTMPYLANDLRRIEVSGTYLDARFFALQAYGADGQLFTSPTGVESAITDYQIVPDEGSQNPWVTDAAPGGTWTVTLTDTPDVLPTSPIAGQANVLPLSTSQAVTPLIPGTPSDTGYLMMRVYLPTGSFAAMRTELPTVTLVGQAGIERILTPCQPQQRAALAKTKDGASLVKALKTRKAPPSADCGDSCPPDLSFFKVGSVSTPFPNADSAYVGALYTPRQGQVVVMRAKMPTTSSGTSPEVWPGGVNLRYWSICNYVHAAPYPAVETPVGGKGTKVFGCTNDTTTPLSKGYATVVVSFPSDKALIKKRLARLPSAVWLPMSPRYGKTQELLAVRNMLANPDFTESATLIPTTGDPSAAAATMASFYPQVGMCSVKTFLKSGTAGCLQ
jgi:hypothetical protein